MLAVICCLNSKYIHASLAPWCLKAGVDKFCNNTICSVVESTINREISYPFEEILKLNPKVIGLCTYIWNVDKTLELAKALKEKLSDLIIVLGGPEVSYRAESVLKEYPFVDIVVSGEGEKPFALLCNAINKGESLSGISGVSYKEDNKPVIAEPNIEKDEPPTPYSDAFLENLNGRICYIESSRGCPYSCAFCLSGRCGGVRFFDIEKTKRDIVLLSKSGTKTVKFVDRTFNANLARAKEIWRFIIENHGKEIQKGVCFHFEIAGDILDDEAINLLSSAPKGLIQLEIGMQSFNPKTLEAINRKTDVEKLKNNIKKLVALRNMHIHIDLIAGLPYEDLESFRDSFNIAYNLNADMLQLGFLKLLYGAPMRENPEKYPCEFSEKAPYTVTKTPWLTESEVISLQNMEDAFDRVYGSGRFEFTLKYLMEKVGVNPFDFFFEMGNKMAIKENISLNDYVGVLYNYLIEKSVASKEVLRDLLAVDKLIAEKNGKLPEILKVKDNNLKAAKTFVRENLGATAAATIIYTNEVAELVGKQSAPAVLGVDYSKKDNVTARYNYRIYKLDDIIC